MSNYCADCGPYFPGDDTFSYYPNNETLAFTPIDIHDDLSIQLNKRLLLNFVEQVRYFLGLWKIEIDNLNALADPLHAAQVYNDYRGIGVEAAKAFIPNNDSIQEA